MASFGNHLSPLPCHRFLSADSPSLVVLKLSGVRREESFLTRSFTLNSSEPSIIIGRSSSRRKQPVSPNQANAYFSCPVVSRRHAEICLSADSQTITITDLGSLHGTALNGTKVTPNVPQELKHGDVIHIGSTLLEGQNKYYAVCFQVDVTRSSLPKPKMREVVDLSSPPPCGPRIVPAMPPPILATTSAAKALIDLTDNEAPKQNKNTYAVPDSDFDSSSVISLEDLDDHTSTARMPVEIPHAPIPDAVPAAPTIEPAISEEGDFEEDGVSVDSGDLEVHEAPLSEDEDEPPVFTPDSDDEDDDSPPSSPIEDNISSSSEEEQEKEAPASIPATSLWAAYPTGQQAFERPAVNGFSNDNMWDNMTPAPPSPRPWWNVSQDVHDRYAGTPGPSSPEAGQPFGRFSFQPPHESHPFYPVHGVSLGQNVAYAPELQCSFNQMVDTRNRLAQMKRTENMHTSAVPDDEPSKTSTDKAKNTMSIENIVTHTGEKTGLKRKACEINRAEEMNELADVINAHIEHADDSATDNRENAPQRDPTPVPEKPPAAQVEADELAEDPLPAAKKLRLSPVQGVHTPPRKASGRRHQLAAAAKQFTLGAVVGGVAVVTALLMLPQMPV